MTTALIAGASGLVGSAALTLLLDSPRYQSVISLVRKPSGHAHPKLNELVVNFDQLAEVKLPAVDDVFCCLGTTRKAAGSEEAFRKVDFTYVVELAKRGKAAGAKQFLLVSSLNPDPKSAVFYSRVKGEAEVAVKAVGYETTVVLQPSILDGDRKEHRSGEKFALGVMNALSGIMVGPMKRYRPILASTVARGLVNAAGKGWTGVHEVKSDAIGAL